MYVIKWRNYFVGKAPHTLWGLVLKQYAHRFDTKEDAIDFVNEKMCMNVKCSSIEIMEVE